MENKNQYYTFSVTIVVVLEFNAKYLIMQNRIVSIFIGWLCCLSSSICGQGSIKVTDHIVFNKDIARLNIALPQAQVKLKETNSSRILVETTVKLPNVSNNLLNYLKTCGRYNLNVKEDRTNSKLILDSSSNLNGKLIVKGEEIKEEISYTIYLPTDVLNNVRIGMQEVEEVTSSINK